MDELQGIYRQALPARIAALTAARTALGDPASAPAAATDIRRIAHALRGSGGTYGFPGISAAAAAVEESADEGIMPTLDALIMVLRDTAAG
jgi:chemotaxis protein histidine kinase CheA